MHSNLKKIEKLIQKIKNYETEQLIHYLMQNDLLCSLQYCNYCNNSLSLHVSKKTSDGMIFKCKTKNCIRKTTTKSIRIGSIFFGYKETLKKIFLSLLYYLKNENVTRIIEIDTINAVTLRCLLNKIKQK